ncbi:MAG: hypothetical protein BWY68_00900 [bacterium ADurb.Bin400]|nr:MAG: hypothetical protein BWY68_00900 [bacterium ADurb.Bin400]
MNKAALQTKNCLGGIVIVVLLLAGRTAVAV